MNAPRKPNDWLSPNAIIGVLGMLGMIFTAFVNFQTGTNAQLGALRTDIEVLKVKIDRGCTK